MGKGQRGKQVSAFGGEEVESSAENAFLCLSSQTEGNLWVWRGFFTGVGSVTLEVSNIEISKVI